MPHCVRVRLKPPYEGETIGVDTLGGRRSLLHVETEWEAALSCVPSPTVSPTPLPPLVLPLLRDPEDKGFPSLGCDSSLVNLV